MNGHENDIMAERVKQNSLGARFLGSVRANWKCPAISDSTGKKCTYGELLIGSVILANRLEKRLDGREMVGILLPPSVGGAVANIAVTLLGKVPVNLNYTVSEQLRDSAVRQCKLSCIVSSKQFLSKLGIEAAEGTIFLEDILEGIGSLEKARAFVTAKYFSRGLLNRMHNRSGDALATVIFSSGSSGEPKGVMLSHNNIISNIDSMLSVFRMHREDCLCGILPFFHSFGFTCTLWLPLFAGVSVSYVANPLDARVVGRAVRKHRCSLMFAAPTFLSGYLRRVDRDDFASLRFIVTGAEKLKNSLADQFERAFGIRPLQGYGATELSPVIALNLSEDRLRPGAKHGNKPGTVGKPIPGVDVRIMHPETSQPQPAGESGLIHIKGPNVMLGYLGLEEKTRKVLQDGWYDTGDIGFVDTEGFLTITDRLSRFSKIGGEMVPHVKLEELLHEKLDAHEQIVAVTGVPAEKKGEQLVVLYHKESCDPETLQIIISESELPNLWKPKRENLIAIDTIPKLGSGKLDITSVRKMAQSAMAGKAM